MKGIVNMSAIIGQWVLVIYSAAIYGNEVGMLMLAAIFLNCLQAVTQNKEG